MAAEILNVAGRKAKIREFLAVAYGKKTSWLKKQRFSVSTFYRWMKLYSKKSLKVS